MYIKTGKKGNRNEFKIIPQFSMLLFLLMRYTNYEQVIYIMLPTCISKIFINMFYLKIVPYLIWPKN